MVLRSYPDASAEGLGVYDGRRRAHVLGQVICTGVAVGDATGSDGVASPAVHGDIVVQLRLVRLFLKSMGSSGKRARRKHSQSALTVNVSVGVPLVLYLPRVLRVETVGMELLGLTKCPPAAFHPH